MDGESDTQLPDQCPIEQAGRIFGVEFNDQSLLQLALVHSSYLNEQEPGAEVWFHESNERLEFLGDAVLGLVVADYLYRKYASFPEGELTISRVSLVRTETLAGWAREFQIDSLLYIARGEQPGGDDFGDRILAGAFEAILGAIYLDQGLERVHDFMIQVLDRDASQILKGEQVINYKGRLQELIQEYDQSTPEYETIQVKGPAHDRYFVVRVTHRGQAIGEGGGSTKRGAQQAAAKYALEYLEAEGNLTTHGRQL